MRDAALVFALALAVRLAYLPARLAWPDAVAPAVDAAYHDYWAWALVTGEWGAPGGQIVAAAPGIEARPYFRPPGYPWFLAAVYAVVGRAPAAVFAVQAVLGAVGAALVVPLGDRLGGRPVGLVAGVLTALTWTLVYFGAELQPPVLVVPLLLGALLLAPSGGIAGRAGAGVLLGAAGVAVPNLLAALPAVAVAGGVRRAAPAVLGCLLVLSVPVARNAVVADAWVLTTNAGINLFAGNNDAANGWDVAVDGFGTSFDHDRLVQRASAAAGRPLTDAEASRWFAGEAVAWIGANPGRAATLTAKRAALWWHGAEVLSNKELNGARAEAWALASPVAAGVLAALAAAAWTRRSHRPTLLLVLATIGLVWASYLPFFVNARYRQPVLPLLACLAALGAVGLWTSERRRLGALGVAVVAVLVHLPGLAPAPERGRWDLAMGVTHARTGDLSSAIARFDTGIERSPGIADLWFERGRAHLRAGRPSMAAADLDTAWDRAPSVAVALDRIRAHRAVDPAAAAAIGVDAQARFPDAVGIAWNTHLAQIDIGDRAGAVRSLEHLLATRPDHAGARAALARLQGP